MGYIFYLFIIYFIYYDLFNYDYLHFFFSNHFLFIIYIIF